MNHLDVEVSKRRTFGIISHPDAGKTTLTEKLLLFGGAIHVAGAIKAKKASKHTTSDFMEIEKQRGISVATSVMGFIYKNKKINILDTPGHKDFSEDTYRTLTAVDSAIMVIDYTKGVESQTHKLMSVCRMRHTPIMTFINKLDREGKEPIELLDEIEDKLKIKVCPISWPIGLGKEFKGVYHIPTKKIYLYNQSNKSKPALELKELDDPVINEKVGDYLANKLREDIELITGVYDKFQQNDYLKGQITPIFFGSALNNFGVQHLLDFFSEQSPPPLNRETDTKTIQPTDSTFSGFIFKIHANIDPKHRDRIAFLRICSGIFERNKKIFHTRTKKQLKFSTPTAFMAQEKSIVDKAYPGDIIGLHDTGNLKIGDTLTDGTSMTFTGIPHFSPEIFKYVVNEDPMKAKQLNTGLQHLCEEGVAQLFTRIKDSRKIVGVVGILQFEVITYRLEHEYKAKCRFETLNFIKAVWLEGDKKDLEEFINKVPNQIAYDQDKKMVYLAETTWSLNREIKENPQITFKFISNINQD